nr:MAG TPA: hypothetical protein [Caudoviricetes sp.]
MHFFKKVLKNLLTIYLILGIINNVKNRRTRQ